MKLEKPNEPKDFSFEETQGVIQLFTNEVLAAAARGEIDLNELARGELCNRGLDENGDWIGFDAARTLMANFNKL